MLLRLNVVHKLQMLDAYQLPKLKILNFKAKTLHMLLSLWSNNITN